MKELKLCFRLGVRGRGYYAGEALSIEYAGFPIGLNVGLSVVFGGDNDLFDLMLLSRLIINHML
jgi:hypothetical protein